MTSERTSANPVSAVYRAERPLSRAGDELRSAVKTAPDSHRTSNRA
jgi:hypothetical protein